MLNGILKKIRFYQVYELYKIDNRLRNVIIYKNLLMDCELDDKSKVNRVIQILVTNGVIVSSIPQKWWYSLIDSIKHKKETEIFLKETKMLNVKVLSTPEWLELSSLLISFTFYKSGLILRRKALSKASSYSRTYLTKYIYSDIILGAALEKLDFKTISSALKNSIRLKGRCGKNKNIKVLEAILENKSWRYFGEKDKNYKKIVAGNRVAIVGPLTDENKFVNEINSFDIVVKINVIDLKMLKNSKIRTEIIYNTNPVMQKFATRYHGCIIDTPLAIICKDSHFYNNLKGQALFRSMPNLNAFTFNGGLNMLQRVIIDLTRFDPSQIKVFGSDLYASLDYSKNYQAGVHKDKYKYYANQLVQHDLISQFIVMKHLHRFNCFIGDKRLEDIITLSLDEYLIRMQHIYRPYVLN